MVRLNKNELPAEQLENLFKQLSALLSGSSSKNVDILLLKLLGPEERIMLAKRMAVAVLLEKGYSHNSIADILHLSTTTIANIESRWGKGGAKSIVSVLKENKSSFEDITELIEFILSFGGIMPSRAGLDRYRGIRG